MREATVAHDLKVVPGLMSNAYRNADGKRVVFGLVFEFDSRCARPCWLDHRGCLSWPKISTLLEREHATVHRFVSHVFRNDDGYGLTLVVAINPLPIQPSTAKNQRVARNLGQRIANFFEALGFGIDRQNYKLFQQIPDHTDEKRRIAYNRKILRALEEGREPVLTVLHEYMTGWEKIYRARRIYPDKRAEAGIAKLLNLLIHQNSKLPLSTKRLVDITGLSASFLRSFLRSGPPWLRARYNYFINAWHLDVTAKGAELEALLARASEL